MSHRLPSPQTKVTYNLNAEDVELLTFLFPGKVNETVRTIMHAYCERLRAQGFGRREG